MSKVKAIICTILLYVVVLTLLLATTNVRVSYDISLFGVLISMMAGFWMADRMGDFYKWLRKKDCNK